MKNIFKDYLDIFKKYPKDEYLTKEERYKLLQEYEKRLIIVSLEKVSNAFLYSLSTRDLEIIDIF